MTRRRGPSVCALYELEAVQRKSGRSMQRTIDVPQVSAFANSRGKTGKSTARMHRTVMTIMMAL